MALIGKFYPRNKYRVSVSALGPSQSVLMASLRTFNGGTLSDE